MNLGLLNQRAIVTGGTRGIGKAVVDLLLAEGCHVGFCARNAEQVSAAVAEYSNSGHTVTGGAIDVSDAGLLKNWIHDTGAMLGGIDIVIANASALVSGATDDDWRRATDVDLLGTVNTVDAATPLLERSSTASIVAVASTAAVNTAGGVRAYSAIKAALINYMSALSNNLGPKGIRANTVSPGAIYFEGGVWDKRKRENPEAYAAAVARNPFGRLGTPEEVAQAVVFLASPAASFVSGTNLIVDGAATTRIQY